MSRFQEDRFPSFDGTQLYARYFPHPASRGFLLILHGHGEHCGRYEKFAAELDGCGLSLGMFDFRGHGRSGGEEVYVNSYEDFLRDVTAAVDFFRTKCGVTGPFYLLGHSNGGLAAMHWAFRNPEKVKALFLSSPLWGLRLPLPLRLMNACFSVVCPHLVYSNPVYPPYLTHNLAIVEDYRKDTLIRRKISARLLNEMLSYARRLDDLSPWAVPFPAYLMMAGLERVVDSRRSGELFGKLQAPDKASRIFPDFYHEIFNELGQEQVFDALREFLDRAARTARKEG